MRIEAGRLRRSLERYYLTDGRGSRVRIEIPRGGYVPVFGSAAPAALPQAAAGAPRVLVTAFEEEGDQSAFPSFTRGFTRSLVIALTRFTGLCVYGAEAALRHPADVDPGSARRAPAADYVITGQTALLPDRFQVDVLLVEAATGRSVWAETFERALRPVRPHRAPQRGGEPRCAGAGAALRRDPGRPGARRRRRGPGDARQLRRGAAVLRLLAHLRPRR